MWSFIHTLLDGQKQIHASANSVSFSRAPGRGLFTAFLFVAKHLVEVDVVVIPL